MLKSLKLFTTIILSANLAFANSADDINTSKDFITKLSEDTISLIQDTKLEEKKKFNLLKDKFLENVDIKWISRFVLGPNFRELTSAQQDEFSNLYREFLVNAYVPKFKEFNQDKIRIESASQIGEHRYKVSTLIDRVNNPDVKVEYMIKPSQTKVGSLQIYDIVAEDVSMITNHRTEFTSVIAEKGYDGMIAHLKKMINQEKRMD
ncbi:MAG: ABC transporter substrate-binding protein [Alphaproteobacteria bacterium]|nr:ABC transporter substrate-binding protein [Alphaproteobacteria bacterium]OJV12235.1 MAG: hypothetical protein BGO27_05815 [Alphaproteobacteria bacterium 33-17]